MIEPALSDGPLMADVSEFRPRGNRLAIWWLGQSGFLLKAERLLVAVDPYLSDSLTKKYHGTDKPHVRMTRGVLAPDWLGMLEVDLITSSHHHTDHLDPDTLRPVVAQHPSVKMVVPRAWRALAHERSGAVYESIVGIEPGETARVGELEITPVPAAHPKVERDAKGHHLYLGYVFKAGGQTIYHSGDTVVYDGMAEDLRRFGQFDLALLPINGKVGNMGGRDAARLAKDIGAKLVVPCHYEMFEFNTADPREEFIPECERIGQPYKVLRAGERLTLGA